MELTIDFSPEKREEAFDAVRKLLDNYSVDTIELVTSEKNVLRISKGGKVIYDSENTDEMEKTLGDLE